MEFSTLCNRIFWDCVVDFHRRWDCASGKLGTEYVGELPTHEFPAGTIEARLAEKVWIDTVQWHLEDVIRDPDIAPARALEVKRIIDTSNQRRTDLVEMIDSYFLERYADVKPQPNARLNTESPAWAIDRLSILSLKIYHMQQEATRQDASAEHRAACQAKLDVLLEQREDLSRAIDELLADYAAGARVMKVYRQMKMYNDPSLNPVLYASR